MLSKTDIEKYFLAEKNESLLFLLIGIVALLLALAFFFFMKTTFFKGAAIPLLVLGLIQVVVGYTVFKRSDSDRIRNTYAYDMNPDAFRNDELPRMKKVNKNFVIYRWTELAFLVAGIILIFGFRNNPEEAFWYGLGITLAIQAALMLGADFFAEKRAAAYTQQIENWLKGNG